MTADTDTMPALPEPFFRTSTTGGAFSIEQMRAYGRKCVEQERERCAKLVEQFPYWLGNQGRAEIAAAIRSQNLIKE